MRKVAVLFFLLGFTLSGYYATWQIQLLNRGYSISQLALLLTIANIVAISIDVPTSALADKIGHKIAVMMGICIYALGFLMPSLSSHPSALAATVIMIAIGDGLIEGALESWTADIKSASGKDLINTKHFMGLDQSQRIGMIFGAFAVPGLISALGVSTTGAWLPYCILSAGTAVFTMRMSPGTVLSVKAESNHSMPVTPSYLKLLTSMQSSTLLILFLASFAFGVSDGAVQLGFWPRMKQVGLSDVALLGIIQASMSLARLISLEGWKRFRIGISLYILPLSLFGASLFSILFCAVESKYALAGIWLLRIAMLAPFFAAQRSYIQTLQRSSGWRATVASAVSTSSTIGCISFTALGGIGIFNSSIQILYVGAGFSALSAFLFWKSINRFYHAQTPMKLGS